jgi:bacillithiol biosynthesis deacetylase BshB1
MEAMALDLLVFGPHPDDLEIGLGGTIARETAAGKSVGLCDLTAGELGSNGTPDERIHEAANAAKVLGAAWRENLRWPDGGIDSGEGTAEQIRSAVELIRRHQPKTIAIPHGQDRHPDHVAANRALTVAAFKSGLRRYDTGQPAWRADWVCEYFINDSVLPSFVVDVSEFYERKREALACHRSQFQPAAVPSTLTGQAGSGQGGAVSTRLTASTFKQLIESRDAQFGALIGVPFAEGFVVRGPVERTSLALRSESGSRRA